MASVPLQTGQPSLAGASAPLVVFDLDGTLLRGDSFAAFLRHLVRGSR